MGLTVEMLLSHAIVTAPSAAPDKSIAFLHGILGSGANWRTFAKQIVLARPEWSAALVDLRLHGESRGFSPPHTVRAAAEDVDALARALPCPLRAVLAHSFGGKVALDLLRLRDGDLDHVFLVDSTPGPRPDARGSESTRHIIDVLQQLPPEFPDRDAFTRWIEGRGIARPVAMWLAMNVRPVPNTTRFVFRVDLDGVRALLDDYFRLDLWDVLEHPPGRVRVHLVVGERSDVVDAADRERARRCPRTTVDVVANAGHWVHVDAPAALEAIVLRHLTP
jgi:pimeloyl-ACP methyl ester carboxylesterase